VARISTDGIPPILFYYSGIVIWNFFSKCLTSTSNTFIANANIFSKVYFPRLVMPLSAVVSALIAFGIQFIIFLIIYGSFLLKGHTFQISWALAALPLLLLIMATLGLGLGIIISSLTTKYRDLSFFIGFGVQLLMYITPVIYPVSAIPPMFQKYIMFNPMAPVVEGFKYALLGAGTFNTQQLFISTITALVIFFIGILLFNRIENRFVDTV
jgi:lipopolysaccharide transport system permease protein